MPSQAAADDRSLLIRDLTSLQIFASVVETQSFSQTARRLGMTPSTVSKHIGALEERLGARLVNRTTRRISITENGLGFYDHCINVLQELQAAETEIQELAHEAKGLLRITAPNVLTTHHISPHLPEFMRRYPEMRLDLMLTSRTI
ncbi:MAG: LysR family transcriptional regulator, partial [Rhodovibrionaceae bacterium]